MLLTLALALVVGYTLGSLPFGYWVSRLFGVSDIRQHGSGNPGAANVWRSVGRSAGLIVLLLDVFKGIMSVAAVSYLPQAAGSDAFTEIVLAEIGGGGAAIIGHMFSPWLGFRGGKGVITGLGVFLAFMPFEAIGSLIVFIITVSVSRYISLGSMVGAVSMFLIIVAETIVFSDSAEPHWAYLILSAAMAGIIVYRHRGNIRRIRDGTEPKFSLSRPGQQLER